MSSKPGLRSDQRVEYIRNVVLDSSNIKIGAVSASIFENSEVLEFLGNSRGELDTHEDIILESGMDDYMKHVKNVTAHDKVPFEHVHVRCICYVAAAVNAHA